MSSVLIMCVGIFVGHYLFSYKYKKLNDLFQVACTVLLIFAMGVVLGSDKDLLSKLSTMGYESFLLFLIPSFCSVVLVYFFTERFLKK